MDDRGRVAQSLTWLTRRRVARAARQIASQADHVAALTRACATEPRSRLRQFAERWLVLLDRRLPHGAGVAGAVFVIAASLAYGVILGGHIPALLGALADVRDGVGNTAGFRVRHVEVSGNGHVSREEILATAGVTATTSLLFLDADQARIRLTTNPWIAEASVLKLYPGELQIAVKEREAFALWQKDGEICVIADDGTVIEPFVPANLTGLPLVVGQGAQTKAKDFLALLSRYPDLRDLVRAAVLVSDRRWNLRLRSGLDIRLPELTPERALDLLVALDREKRLLTRDIALIDLRLTDRVTVRLSEAAAQARAEALKDKKPKKGRDA